MKKFKKLTIAAAASVALLAPVSAFAFIDYAHEETLQAARIEILEAISDATSTILDTIAQAEESIIEAIRSEQNALSSEGEKQSGAQKELTQGRLNYQAQNGVREAAAKAQEAFGDDSSTDSMCSTLDSSNQAGAAAGGAKREAKVLSAGLGNRRLYTSSAGQRQKEVIDTHNNLYCSKEDSDRNRCTAVNSKVMQDADVNAGTLLAPANDSTYSEDEALAAKDFIKMVTNPVPHEMLPPAFEKTAAGKSFVLAQRIAQAQMSVADFSLSSIETSHEVSTEGEANGLSMIGWLSKSIRERFANPEWNQTMASASDPAVILRDIAIQMSQKNYLDFLAYQQSERMEAVLATQLAITAREHNDRILNSLRAAATNPAR